MPWSFGWQRPSDRSSQLSALSSEVGTRHIIIHGLKQYGGNQALTAGREHYGDPD